ncbi:MAG: ribosome small subunit-dependent GTPase A, partial [Lachnospiraceae bacterium]|nr:ribosome small subunit-dependent GTPase A [Lachnospiraceae bacterium]
MSGRIIKAVSGFYYVKPDRGQEAEVPPKDGDVYQCRAKGIFRKKKLSPLVGDSVLMELTATDGVEGNV